MIITFSTTAALAAKLNKPDPLLNGIKQVTRRAWKDTHAQSFIKHWRSPHKAYDKATYQKGKQIGWLYLSCPPYQEQLRLMPKEDLYLEGDLWNSFEDYFQCINCTEKDVVWVVRFKFSSL